MTDFQNTVADVEREILDTLPIRSPSPVVFDVGANVGHFTEEVYKRWPDARVSCFEPNPRTFDVLWERFSDRADLYMIAVGAEDAVLPLFDAGPGFVTASLIDLGKEPPPVNVPCRRLEHYIEQSVDLLKIDVEGYEWEVLRGLDLSLRPSVIRCVMLEYHGPGEEGHTIAAFETLFRSRGYDLVRWGGTENYGYFTAS